MHSRESLISAGKSFFSTDIQSFSSTSSPTVPYTESPSQGGVILIGLGPVGGEALHIFFEHLLENRSDHLPVVRAISLSIQDDQLKTVLDPRFERFLIGGLDPAERVGENNVDNVHRMLANFNKYLVDLFNEFRFKHSIGADIRLFLVGSLAESEIGLLHPIVDLISAQKLCTDRSLFLSFNAMHPPALDEDRQYAAVREISHYLYGGAHAVNKRDGRDTHIRDKLLERAYFFEGSKNRVEDQQQMVAAVAQTLFSLVCQGAALRRYESSMKGSVGDHFIRTVGIRRIGLPVLELRNYLAVKYMRSLWDQNLTLLPSYGPEGEDINERYRAFYTEQSYKIYLNQWMGPEFAGWLLNQGSQVPVINEKDFSQTFIQRIVDFVSDVDQPDRFAIAWAGLSFIEGRVAGFPSLHRACKQLGDGLEKLFDSIPFYRAYLDNLAAENKRRLDATVRGTVNRWNVRNLDEHIVQIFDRLQVNRIRDWIHKRSGILAKNVEDIKFSAVFITGQPASDFVLSDHIWHNYSEYFSRLYHAISDKMLTELLENVDGLQSPDEGTLQFLSEAENLFATFENAPTVDGKIGFLISSDRQDIEMIRRRAFQYTSAFTHIPVDDNRSLTALVVQPGLKTGDFLYVRRCSETYIPNEKIHLDEHLQNAAYFESRLRGLTNIHRRPEPFCEHLIMTLADRNAPTAFFHAYMAGMLFWDREWRIEAFSHRGREYAAISLGRTQNADLTQPLQKENIKSLWDSYCRFTMGYLLELDEGAFHDSLHANNRDKYLNDLTSVARKRNDSGQNKRRKWLDDQDRDRRGDIEVHDFYRLFRAVIRNS